MALVPYGSQGNGNVGNLEVSVSPSALGSGISAASQAISTVGVLENADPVALSVVYAAVQTAVAPFAAAIAALDAAIDENSVGSVVAGVLGQTTAPLLYAQMRDVEKEAKLIIAQAFLIRAGANIAGAIGPGLFAPNTQTMQVAVSQTQTVTFTPTDLTDDHGAALTSDSGIGLTI